MRTRPHRRLYPRERQVALLIALGCSNKQIATVLGITEGTVKVYVSKLLVDFGVSTRLEIAVRTMTIDRPFTESSIQADAIRAAVRAEGGPLREEREEQNGVTDSPRRS